MSKRRTRFVTWCKKDTEDTTKIFYTFRMYEMGVIVTKKFTSDDELPYSMIGRIRDAWIESIELTTEGWKVTIYED